MDPKEQTTEAKKSHPFIDQVFGSLANYFFDMLKAHKISLALVVSLWIMFSPSYNNFLQLVHTVSAHSAELKENREMNLMINEKLNLMMIEMGITKEKVRNIEDHYKPTVLKGE